MKITTRTTREHDIIREAINDLDIEEVEFLDDESDPDIVEIRIVGRIKEDAFEPKGNNEKTPKEDFDSANPF